MKAVRTASTILLILSLWFNAACGPKKKVKITKPARIGSTESGIASWYGIPYHGRRAANGEIYDMEKLTAAHRTLPFGTWVRVKNLSNNKTVDVRIQDRGPFVAHRIIDLSRAAAREIDILGPGTANVKLTVIAPSQVRESVTAKPADASAPSPPPIETSIAPDLFAVQIGAFQDQSKAESLRASMAQRYGSARIMTRQGSVPLFRVLVGQEDSMEKVGALAERMRLEGSEGFVVRLDVAPPSN